MDAAYSAGPRRMSKLCMMYGDKVQSGDSCAHITRPMYPMASTGTAMSARHTGTRSSNRDLHRHPMRNGKKYHVFLLTNM